jgi:hypothetical protein
VVVCGFSVLCWQRKAAAIVASGFPSYAPRFFAGAGDPQRVEGITRRAREIMQEISALEEKPAARQDKSDYPTDEQMTTMFSAWKAGGKEGIRQALREARVRQGQKKE